MLRRIAAIALTVSLALGGTAHAAGPDWAALTLPQRQALAPLEREWPGIDAQRKSKWLEVAARFPAMPEGERARLQDRMADWARLTPAERSSARLQFQETRRLGPDDRQAQWEAYQALPEDQRKALAQQSKPAARTAAASKPGADTTAKRNLVQATAVPPVRAASPTVQQAKPGATTLPMTAKGPLPPAHHQPGMPKITATPGFVDPSTLLPKRGPQGAAARTAASSDPAEQP